MDTIALLLRLQDSRTRQIELQFAALRLANKLFETCREADPNRGRMICEVVLRWVSGAEQRLSLLQPTHDMTADFAGHAERLRSAVARQLLTLEVAQG